MIDVADNGMGMPPEVADSLLDEDRPEVHTAGSGTGVRNVHQRIRLTYPETPLTPTAGCRFPGPEAAEE